jgi:hypothetical protein
MFLSLNSNSIIPKNGYCNRVCARRQASLRPNCALALILLTMSPILGGSQIDVKTYHYDNGRTGQNVNEIIVTPSNVNHNRFGKLFEHTVDGQVYAQPLYVAKLTIPSKGTHNVVFVATQADSMYAFDADTNIGANAKPLWHASLLDGSHGAGQEAMAVTLPVEMRCTAIAPTIGITSTPAIDGNRGTIYVEAFSQERGTPIHRLHALDIRTGTEIPPGPVVITAKVRGSGIGSVNGTLNLDPLHQLNRSGLLLVNGLIYIAYASHCDRPPAHGWILAYDARSLTQQGVFITTPNGWHGGV